MNMKQIIARQNERYEKIQIMKSYKWRHGEWLKSKIKELYATNPEYAEKLRNGEAELPYRWTWEAWYQNEKFKENDLTNYPIRYEQRHINI